MTNNYSEQVAIIACEGRFPGANTCEELWDIIASGKEVLSHFTPEQLEKNGIDHQEYSQDAYVPVKGCIENAACFDANFFGISPASARLLDPQHRLLLECAWHLIERAGYNPSKIDASVGVYAAASSPTYLLNQIYKNNDFLASHDQYQLLLANDKDYLASRIAFKLNLKGPVMTVQTGCSSSLVAVHLAVQSILAGECDMAIAGGVALSFPLMSGYRYQKSMIGSPDGHCYAFDERAEGTVRGDGVGLVLLKALDTALEDGDQIVAVIRGSAVNNDGSQKVGFTAPSVDQQAAVIREAIAVADLPMEAISYIETHGTGTELGDPIEAEALTQAFNNASHQCALTSLKPNVGHLDAAAGIAGLIKVCLALQHKQLPPAINFKKLNSKINFTNTPFYINTELQEWKPAQGERNAGVSSFGIGGTNVHLVVGEFERPKIPEPAMKIPVLITVSAKTESALSEYIDAMIKFFQENETCDLSDVAYTSQIGRKAFAHRYAFTCTNIEEAIHKLQNKSIPNFEDNKPEPQLLAEHINCFVIGDNSSACTHKPENTDLSLLAKLWMDGREIDWGKLHVNKQNQRITIPCYPFQRQSYFVEIDPIEKQDFLTTETKNISPEENLEKHIQLLWSALLGVDEISLDANFFELGGDSLLAVNFIDQLPDNYQEKLSAILLFEYPTIRELCEFLKDTSSTKKNNETDIAFDEREALSGDLYL